MIYLVYCSSTPPNKMYACLDEGISGDQADLITLIGIIYPGQATSPWSDWQPQCSNLALPTSSEGQGGLMFNSASRPNEMSNKVSCCYFL